MIINYHVIKDPVHGVMEFTTTEDAWIKPFIDHPLFQRLRHIKQLGMADLVFPGAMHTRFNHGLGCCYVAGKIARKIGLTEDERQLVMIAGLLHDIGHGPFSHTFEDLFPERAIRHEMWTPYFLNAFLTDEFVENYNQLNPEAKLTSARLKEIEQIIMHVHPNKLLTDIVSSQLDADRFDYLLRDSHFCGVSYGEFDLNWMVHCLCIVETDDGPRLGVNHKGVGVVEHYLMARRLMIRNIYHHSKKFAIENLLMRLFKMLADAGSEATFLSSINEGVLGQFIEKAADYNRVIAKEGITAENTHVFFEENFTLYNQLRDYHVNALIAELAEMDIEHDVIALAKRIHFRRLPDIFSLSQDQVEQATKAINELKQNQVVSDWQLQMIEMPQLAYSVDEDPIHVMNKSGKTYPLSDMSMMVCSLSDRYEHVCLLFIDHEIVDKVDLNFLQQ